MTGKRAAFAAGLLVFAGIAFWAISDTKKVEKQESVKPVAATQQMEGLRLEGTGANGSKWTLTAEKAQSDPGGEIGQLSDVSLKYTAGELVTTGKAARAERKTADGAYTFSGGVVLTRDEWKAETDAVDYDPQKGLVSGSGEVSVSSEEISITGIGFVVDMNGSVARINSSSHAVVNPRKGAAR